VEVEVYEAAYSVIIIIIIIIIIISHAGEHVYAYMQNKS
jgi:hypothetical protein